jgi:hypothetical protein
MVPGLEKEKDRATAVVLSEMNSYIQFIGLG